MFFVYIIESIEYGRYYIGQTVNLDSRIERHNKGMNKSTKAYKPWKLRWWKEFETRSEAIITERKLKGIKKRAILERYISDNEFYGVAGRSVAQPGPVTQKRDVDPRKT